MLKKVFLFLVLPLLAFASQIADPVIFMKTLTADVVADLNKLPNAESNPELYITINKKILPHVDVEFMGRWVAGRKAWLEATDTQQKTFLHHFTKLLSRTYSKTLLVFKDQEMKYYRMGSGDYEKVTRVQVICEIQQTNKDPIKSIYQLHLVDHQWKIFDILVEGVSMLKGLQAQYVDIIAQKGIDGAINLMESKLGPST